MVGIVEPTWPKPLKRVRALTTTRSHGYSSPPFDGLNLGLNSGDKVENVAKNRQLLAKDLELKCTIQWLAQEHGTNVVTYFGDSEQKADGVYALKQQQPCAVLTADCLPVFLTDTDEKIVAVVHAGWRGLANGILDEAVEQMRKKTSGRIMAAFGPAISWSQFEVGLEVVEKFKANGFNITEKNCRYKGDKAYLALYQLAKERLVELRVVCGSLPHWCTFNQSSSFYSYRRDGVTGRMASLIWINDSA